MSTKIRRVAAAVAVLVAVPATAQTAWSLRASDADTTYALRAEGVAPEAAALDSLHRWGHLRARVDSVANDTVYATAGAVATIAILDLVGAEALDPTTVRRSWESSEGAAFRPERLSRDLATSASAYARAGFAGARLTPDVRAVDGGRRVEITVRIDEGTPAPVEGVELVGGRGTGRAFAARITGVQPGTPAALIDADRVRRALDATGLYLAVGEPVLARTEAGALVLQVPVDEAPPGTFDVVLGYLPPAAGVGGQVVGSGRVDLRNVFGAGRLLHLELVRNPGLVSTFAVAARDPFVLGSPIGLGGRFEGDSRDSTYSRQRFAVDVSYRVTQALTLIGSLNRETIRPGTFGAELVDGRPRIRRTDAFYVGAGVEYVSVDAPANPRRGLALSVSVDQGRPRRAIAETSDPAGSGGVQRRLQASVRAYVPTFARQGAVFGLDASLIRGEGGGEVLLDDAELYRLGGARSLRGYDEDAFLGSTVGRLLTEYRLLLDAAAYAFAFGDLGLLDRPAEAGEDGVRRVLPAYGAGIRLQTGVGLASISYALNPDLPIGRGKVHIGLVVGL